MWCLMGSSGVRLYIRFHLVQLIVLRLFQCAKFITQRVGFQPSTADLLVEQTLRRPPPRLMRRAATGGAITPGMDCKMSLAIIKYKPC